MSEYIDEPTKAPEPSSAADLTSVRRSSARPMDSGLSPWEPEAAQLLLLKKCQDLLKQRLSGPLEKLFVELTGLRLHVVWHEPLDFHQPKAHVVCCPAARRRREPNGQLPAICRTCLEEHWPVTAQPAREGHRFVGACGLTNFCVSFHVGIVSHLLTLGLQAEIKDEDSACGSGVFATAFENAVALVRLIHQDFEMTVRASVAQTAVDHLERRLRILALENTQLRQQPPPRLEFSAAPIHQAADSRAQQIVQEMVAYVHEHYQRQMSLGVVAAALKMNAAYLCHLFSRTLGVTFHQYLTELRMTKAKELLREPHRRVCEVACAVGYASADQFRHSFKAHAGVAPSAWR
jgi:AraC-like DNA-binding protein